MADSLHLEAVKDGFKTAQHHLIAFAQDRPRLAGTIVLTVITLLATRLITTIQFHLQRARTAKAIHPVNPPVPPYSIPYVANALYYLDLVPNIKRIFDNYPLLTSFTFRIFGGKHHVILAPSMVHQMSTQTTVIPKVTLMPFILRTIENVWGDKEQLLRNMPRGKLDKVHSYLAQMMHPTFLNANVPKLAASLSTNTPDLITFSRSIVDQPEWERAARVVTSSANTATAELFTLIRHFAAALTTDIFFSPDLIVNHPNILSDLYFMDTRFEELFAGFPAWLPSNRGPAAARNRVVSAMREQVVAFWEYDNGRDPGSAWSRIGETCEPMANRIRGCAVDGDFDPSVPAHKRGMKAALCNAAILWALQVNATPSIFWMVYYAFSDPALLADLRAEMAPYISIAKPESSFPGGIKEKPQLKIDAPGLRTNAKLMLGAFHEVMRMETFSLTYKLITDDFTLSESHEDAAMFGRPGDPKTIHIGKGDYIVVPHTLHQYDDRYFPDPLKFDARRFWIPSSSSSNKDGNDDEPEKLTTSLNLQGKKSLDPAHVEVSYLTAHPWGGGAQLCKGKKFAEHEVLMITAALIYLWDFVPVTTDYLGKEVEIKWRHPGRANHNATARPERDVWVRASRREGIW